MIILGETSLRLRLLDFFSFKWLLNDRPDITLPVGVTLKRLDKDLRTFNLDIYQ